MAQSRIVAKSSPPKITRILAPTDFSLGAEPALQWAMHLADVFGAQMTILHAVDVTLGAIASLPSDMAAVPAYGELLQVVRQEARAEMAKLAERYPAARHYFARGHRGEPSVTWPAKLEPT